jgi:hypothetical protein
VIANYAELQDVGSYEIADMFGIQPNTTPDISKARATAKQLLDLGYDVVRDDEEDA